MRTLHIDAALKEFGWERLLPDFGIYAEVKGENRVWLALYVDDVFIIGKVIANIGEVKLFLHDCFRIKDQDAT